MLYFPTSVESIPAIVLPIAIVAVYLTIIVILAETVNRLIANNSANNSEFTRKIVHIGSGNVILLAWWLDIPIRVIIGASAIAAMIALTSYFLPILPSINSVGRKSWGTFFYAISIGILAWSFWDEYPQYTAIGILIMTWGDGMAAIIGQKWGKHKYQLLGITKSWEGSLTMAGISFLISSLILWWVWGNIWQTWLISGSIALVAASLEAFSKLGIDNLTVPVASATIAFFLGQWLLYNAL